MNNYHVPIMVGEILSYLNCQPNQTYVDCTLGNGGHALEILKKNGPRGILVGIDQDAGAIEIARKRLAEFGDRVIFVQDNFRNLKKILSDLNISQVGGVLADIGVSSTQLLSPERGFSFNKDSFLDMRMNEGGGGKTAADLLNELSEAELTKVIRDYGEEKWAKSIARNIIIARQVAPLKNTFELVHIIRKTIPEYFQIHSSIHPATRTFQALRIAVNDELGALKNLLERFFEVLKVGGRICVITFHSLEDRIVKEVFHLYSQECICSKRFPQCICEQKKTLNILTKKPVIPSDGEIKNNPRSRSSKLRAAEKI